MRFISLIIILLFLFSFSESHAQIMKLDFDSVYVICKYKDLKKRIKKDNDKETSELKLYAIDSLLKVRKDTVLIGRQLIYDYHEESDELVKANKVKFFDQRTNKLVTKVERTKEGKKGMFFYYSYRDAVTRNELYEVGLKTWMKF